MLCKINANICNFVYISYAILKFYYIYVHVHYCSEISNTFIQQGCINLIKNDSKD